MTCRPLKDIHIPNSVTHIGDKAFGGCEDIGNINIPNSVTHIGNYAFYGCKALQSINMPNSVTHIGKFALWLCREDPYPININIPKGSMAKFMQLLPKKHHNHLVER